MSIPPRGTTLQQVGGAVTLRMFWPILPLAVGLALSLLLFLIARDRGLWERWSDWIGYPLWPVFNDLYITLDHMREAAGGADPLADPKSEFAYPRAVLAFRHLGLHNIPAYWLALAQNLAVVGGIVLVVRPTTPKLALATSLLLISPSLRLGFERANLDFALFLLCAAGAAWWSYNRHSSRVVWPIAALMLGALLKLYPLFAIVGGAVAEKGKRRLAWLGGAVLVAGFWWLNRAEIGLIAQKIPVAHVASWGCLVVLVRLERFVGVDQSNFVWAGNLNFPAIALAAYALAAVVALFVGLKLSRRFRAVSFRPVEWCGYWVGASICCGSFLGANFAFRWVYLTLAIPLLLRLVYAPDRFVAVWSRLTLLAMAVSLGAPLEAERFIFLVTQFANWACVLFLLVGCAALPRPADVRKHAKPAETARPEESELATPYQLASDRQTSDAARPLR